jgi:hypothetical protein
LLLLLLAACGLVSAAQDTETALRREHDVSGVFIESTNGSTTVSVTWQPTSETVEGLAAEEREVARVVWETTPLRVDAVELVAAPVTIPDEPPERHTLVTRSELTAEFGPRDASLDREGAVAVLGKQFVWGAGLAVVLGVVGIVAIARGVRRSRRRRESYGYPAGSWGAPPGQWPGQPPGTWPAGQAPWPAGPAPGAWPPGQAPGEAPQPWPGQPQAQWPGPGPGAAPWGAPPENPYGPPGP